MADTSSFMDWEPQTPPPLYNPYPADYMPGGWLVTPPPPPPPTTGVFLPAPRPGRFDNILPAAKRVCRGLATVTKATINATTKVVTVPTCYIIRQCQENRRERRRREQRQRPRPQLSQSPWNRAVAREAARAPRPIRHVLFQTPPPAETARKQIKIRTTPHPKKQETAREGNEENNLYEVPEFRPDHIWIQKGSNATPREHYRRKRLKDVFPGMPRFTPPKEPKPFIIATPEQKPQKPVSVCAQLQSPYPQLESIPATFPSPAATITSTDSATPSEQLLEDLYAATDSDSDGATVISSVTNSRKRRIHIQGSRTTEDGETSATAKRLQTEGPSAISPKTPTPAIVVQDAASSAANIEAPTPVNTSLLSPLRMKIRKISTPKSLNTPKTLPKSPKTPQTDFSSTCDVSPGNHHLDAARSPVKSEISSFFEGTPPQNPEQDAHVFRMITTGGGSPTPPSRTLAEGVKVNTAAGAEAANARLQALRKASNGNQSAAEKTQDRTTQDPASAAAEVTSERLVEHPGLANQAVHSESSHVTEVVEQADSSEQADPSIKEPSVTTHKQQTSDATSTFDLTDDKETNKSSSSTISTTQTPEKQLAQLNLEDKYTPEQPTPKASPHSAEKTIRRTRGETKRQALLEEKSLYNIVALAQDWEEKIETALRYGHGAFKASDFTRVVPLSSYDRGTDQWLNDEVINGYLNLIVEHGKKGDRETQVPSYHAFASFFYSNLESRGYDSVKRWASRAKIGGKKLLDVEGVFIPINSGAHWTLCVVSGKNKTITHYNSLRGSGRRYINVVKTWVAAELGSNYNESDWTFVETGESPLQNNMDDCGVFTVTSARQLMLGLTTMSYSRDMIPLQRKRIVAELVNGALLKSNM